MGRKRTVGKAILCVAVAAAMLMGVAIPKVYAATYNVDNVTEGEIKVNPEDILKCPNETSVCYQDDNDKILKSVSVTAGGEHTVLDYEAVRGSGDTIPEGKVFDGWLITAVPGTSGGQLKLRLCLKEEGNVISTAGTRQLTSGETYTLQGGIKHVDSDTTTYANPITFKVSQSKPYTFK